MKELTDEGVQGIIYPYKGEIYNITDSLSPHFLELLEDAKNQKLNVIVELTPGSTDFWFYEPDFADFYIWKDRKMNDDPPNNWLNPQNESAWKLDSTTNKFYLELDSKPQLNFREQKVVDTFKEVLKKFLNAGAAGVRLRGGPRLLVDPSFADEIASTNKLSTIGDYNFYSHTKTMHLSDLGDLLSQWRSVVKNHTSNGPFMLAEELPYLEPYKTNGHLVIDLPKHSHMFSSGNKLNATLLKRNLDSAFILLENNWPLWEVN